MKNKNLNKTRKNLGRNLDSLLEEISVMPPGQWENELSKTKLLGDWYAVCSDLGIIAYFGTESDAFRFRLDYINQILNG